MATVTPNFNWPVPTSTDLVKDGAVAIEALGDSIDASLVDLKGGTTGQVLSKASNTDMDFTWVTNADGDITGVTAGTGLTGGGTSGTVSLAFDQTNYGGGQFAAGKNKIINGDFGIWQRGTSFSTTASLTYTADRWWTNAFSGTATVSQQTFTPGTAPVSGYEGQYFLRFANTSTFTQLGQRIEDVRVFAGQTVTMSFWAKAASALTLTPYLEQNFGTGGSASTYTSGTGASVTTSWQRFTATVSLGSIAGKTIGTSSFLNFYFLTTTLSTNIDIWGVQVEAGSTATPFQTATGNLQGELLACMRYFQILQYMQMLTAVNATTVQTSYQMAVPMRGAPSASVSGIINLTNDTTADFAQSTGQISLLQYNTTGIRFSMGNFSGMTTGAKLAMYNASSTTNWINLSAEL